MTTLKLSAVLCLSFCSLLLTGCADDLRIQNERQRKEISDLSSKLQANKLLSEQMQNQVVDADNICKAKTDKLQQTVDALEQDVKVKRELIASMGGQLLGGMALPVELSTMLEDFAKGSDMISYDPNRGVVKFQSDLLFDKGSDQVASSASESIKSLCTILNSDVGKKFDVIIAGHTDDIPIGRAETKAKHPTNWHLSVDRAISVLNLMGADGVSDDRMSVRGFGEYRPIVPNEPNKKGNPKNRRVEIYIIPKGA